MSLFKWVPASCSVGDDAVVILPLVHVVAFIGVFAWSRRVVRELTELDRLVETKE